MTSAFSQSQIGPYVIDKELGRGGMGVVYRARHQGTGQIVAIKTLIQQHQAAHARSLIDEALTGKKIDHKNCLKSFEILAYGPSNSPAIVSEYIEGQNLREFLDSLRSGEEGHRFSPLCATLILEQLFFGLRAAHKAGLIHQDIKPENYLIPQFAINRLIEALEGEPDDLEDTLFEMRDKGWAKLSDWGLSILKERDRKSNSQSLSLSLSQIPEGKRGGTIVYMPLEQIDGVGISRRTDIFALSLIYYELLTGQAPISARSAAEGLSADTFEVLQNYLIQMISSTATAAIDPKKDPYLKPIKRYPQVKSLLLAMSMRQKNDRLGSAELEEEIEQIILSLEDEPAPAVNWALYISFLTLLLPIALWYGFTRGPVPAQDKKVSLATERSPIGPTKLSPANPELEKYSPEYLDRLRNGDPATLRSLKHIDRSIGRALRVGKHSLFYLNSVESLTLEGARELSKYKGQLGFERLKTLSPEIMKELASFAGPALSIGFTQPVDNAVFQALSRYKGLLSLRYPIPLTKENAEALAAYSGLGLTLFGKDIINAKSALPLASIKTAHLTFLELSELDDVTALALAQFSGTSLSLPKITSLNSLKASTFSGSKVTKLNFQGLRFLKPDAARSLVKYKGDSLSIGLLTMDVEVATALKDFKGKTLMFGQLQELSMKVASVLRHCQTSTLSFQALKSMNAIAAKELAQFRGEHLILGGSIKLGIMHAFSLSQFTGSSINLINIGAFDGPFLPNMKSYPGALKIKASQKPIFASARAEFLKARPAWAKSILDALRSNRALAIIAMTKMTREVAHELESATEEKLEFQSLEELDFIQAGHLARTKAKSLHFPKLKTLNKETREALFRFKGEISINGKVEQSP